MPLPLALVDRKAEGTEAALAVGKAVALAALATPKAVVTPAPAREADAARFSKSA